MKAKVGLWIDHKKAIIVTLTEKGEEIKVIDSEAEKQLRRTGDSPLKGRFDEIQAPSDTARQRIYSGQLKIFYDAILTNIRDAESVLIFGPGEAKTELKEYLESNHFLGHITGIETADKMTNPQILVKVRAYFAG